MRKSNSKILVTGGLGYIGNEVVGELLKNGIKVVVNDFDSVAKEKFLPLWSNRIEYIHDDVCELKCPEDVDMVVHLAAEVGYVACDKKSKEAIRTNIEGTKNVASFKKPTIFFSTGSVYGKVDEICTESTECNPQTIYAQTKKDGEEIIRANVSEYCIVRPATAFGLSYKTRNDLLVHNLIKVAVEEAKVTIYQSRAMRTIFHVSRIAQFVSHCLSNWKAFSCETFNLGHESGNISKKEILDCVREFVEFDLIYGEGIDFDQRDYFVDYNKLHHFWPNQSPMNLKKHFAQIVNHYQLSKTKLLKEGI